MSREDDKRRKEAEWFEDSQTAWKHNGYLVTKVPGMSHLYRVRTADDQPVDELSGVYTQRTVAYEAIDQHVAKQGAQVEGA